MKDPATAELSQKLDKLQQLMRDSFKAITIRFDMIEKRLDRLEQKQEERHNLYMTHFDNIFGEIATLRDENTIGAHHTSQLRRDVDIIKRRLAI